MQFRHTYLQGSKLKIYVKVIVIFIIVNFFTDACHPYEPFKCPGDGNCISIQYLCDGAPDCSDGYDEDMRLCTAGKRHFHILHILHKFNLP